MTRVGDGSECWALGASGIRPPRFVNLGREVGSLNRLWRAILREQAAKVSLILW
jgi:hypothetical protein